MSVIYLFRKTDLRVSDNAGVWKAVELANQEGNSKLAFLLCLDAENEWRRQGCTTGIMAVGNLRRNFLLECARDLEWSLQSWRGTGRVALDGQEPDHDLHDCDSPKENSPLLYMSPYSLANTVRRILQIRNGSRREGDHQSKLHLVCSHEQGTYEAREERMARQMVQSSSSHVSLHIMDDDTLLPLEKLKALFDSRSEGRWEGLPDQYTQFRVQVERRLKSANDSVEQGKGEEESGKPEMNQFLPAARFVVHYVPTLYPSAGGESPKAMQRVLESLREECDDETTLARNRTTFTKCFDSLLEKLCGERLRDSSRLRAFTLVSVQELLGDQATDWSSHTTGTDTTWVQKDMPFFREMLSPGFTVNVLGVPGVPLDTESHAVCFFMVPVSMAATFRDNKEFEVDNAPSPEEHHERYSGGERAALSRLHHYLWVSHAVSTYKRTRDGSFDQDCSTRLSMYLAHGCISARTVLHELDEYERSVAQNDSTYWLIFELLWRDFLHLAFRKYARKFFSYKGIQGRVPKGWRMEAPALFREGEVREYPDLRDEDATVLKPEDDGVWKRFESWSRGETGFPFVDASMRQLRKTGYMSNRGRQNSASFVVHSLGVQKGDRNVDWRWGAELFEHFLLDHDVASNWGGWMTVAGVGFQKRENVHNVIGQSQRYEPDGRFAMMWIPEFKRIVEKGEKDPADAVDLASSCAPTKCTPLSILVHTPWELPATHPWRECLPAIYASPVVDPNRFRYSVGDCCEQQKGNRRLRNKNGFHDSQWHDKNLYVS